MSSSKVGGYIRWAVFELACRADIDHRNYDGSKKESRLKTHRNILNSCDEAIEKTALELLTDEQFKNQYSQYCEKLKANANDEDEDDDFEYETKPQLFNYVVDFIGLYEIFNLHEDDRDDFQDKFFEMIWG